MSNSNKGSGSILEFTGDEPKDRRMDTEDNGDGTFSITLKKISRDPKTNDIIVGDAVRSYNTGNANDMNTLRRDFGINNKTYKLQGETSTKEVENFFYCYLNLRLCLFKQNCPRFPQNGIAFFVSFLLVFLYSFVPKK